MPVNEQQFMGPVLSFLVHRGEVDRVPGALEVLGEGLGWVVVGEYEAGTLDQIRTRGAPVLPWNHGPVWYNGRTINNLGPALSTLDTPPGQQVWLLQLKYPVDLHAPSWPGTFHVLGTPRQDLVLVVADRDEVASVFASEGPIAAVHDWRYSDAQGGRQLIPGFVAGSAAVRPVVVRVTGPQLPWELPGHRVAELGGVRWVRTSCNAADVATLLESPFVLAVQAFEAAEASGCGCSGCCCCGVEQVATVTPRSGPVQATGIGDEVSRTLLPTTDATLIAFSDTGCDAEHDDLRGRVEGVALLPALDVLDAVGGPENARALFRINASDDTLEDPYGHGTHVVGIAIGNGTLRTTTTRPVAVAPAPNGAARMVSVVSTVDKALPTIDGFRFSGVRGNAFFGIPIDISELFEWMRTGLSLADRVVAASPRLAYILNCSWNFKASSYGYASQITDAWCAENSTALLVFSAGNNDGGGPVAEPALAKNVLTVGASNGDGVRILASRSGVEGASRQKPDVLARGDEVWSTGQLTASGVAYTPKGGTSMAAPFVAGLAARIREQLVAESGEGPTAALLKAILVHLGAQRGPQRPLHQVDATTDLIAGLVRFDEPDLQNGDVWRIVVKPGPGARATLVWTDPATADGSIYNELLLRVTETGTQGDKGDNVQSLAVTSTSNVVTIEVVGATVRTANQAFALVLSGLTPMSAPERVLAAEYTHSNTPLPNPIPTPAASTTSALVTHLASLPSSVELIDERLGLRQRRFELTVEPGAEELWMYLDASADDIPHLRLSAVCAGRRVQVPLGLVDGRVTFRVPAPTARTTLVLDMPAADPVSIRTVVRRRAELLDVRWRTTDDGSKVLELVHGFHRRAPLESVTAWVREGGAEVGPIVARQTPSGFVEILRPGGAWPGPVRLLCTWMEPETGVRYRRYSRWIEP